MGQKQQPNQIQKSKTEKSNENVDIGANNPVKKESGEKRDFREDADKANQNLGSEKYRNSNVNSGQTDQSAR